MPAPRKSLLQALHERIFGTKSAPRTSNDGILHSSNSPDGFAKSVAERVAVSRVLQHFGVAEPRQHLDRYMAVMSWLAKNRPEHPVVKPYVQAARALNIPEMSESDRGPIQVSTTEAGSGSLHGVALPFVRFTNRVLREMDPSHPVLNVPRGGTGRPEPQEQVQQPKKPANPQNEPEFAPSIRPVSETGVDKFRIGLVPTPKKTQNPPKNLKDSAPVPDSEPPIPLVNYPGETGRSGDRWKMIHEMHSQGHQPRAIVQALSDRFALTPRNAAATYKRWKSANKLARGLYVNPGITPDDSINATIPFLREFYQTQGDMTSIGALADHLEEIGSPLAGLYRSAFEQGHRSLDDILNDLGPPLSPERNGYWEGLYHGGHVSQKLTDDFENGSVFHQYGIHPLPDGRVKIQIAGHISGRNHSYDATRAHTYVVVDRADAEEYLQHLAGGRQNAPTPPTDAPDEVWENYDNTTPNSSFYWGRGGTRDTDRSMERDRVAPHELLPRLRNGIEAVTGRPLNQPHQLARRRSDWIIQLGRSDSRISTRHLVQGVDKQIAGTRLAFHLRQIEQQYTGTHIGTLARMAIAGTGSPDPYADLGKALKEAGDKKWSGAYRWHKMNDGLRNEALVEKFLRQHLAAPPGSAPLTDHQLFTRAAAAFHLNGSAKTSSPEKHAGFWVRLRDHVRKYGAGSQIGDREINRALLRLSERYEDRKELKEAFGSRPHKPRPAATPAPEIDPLDFKALAEYQGPGDSGRRSRDPDNPKRMPRDVTPMDYHWRDAFSWLPGADHMKFQRIVTPTWRPWTAALSH